MARSRRGRSRGPELRGTLGTLLRTTLAQAGAMREVIERGAREGRARLEEARSGRRRSEALAELGELVIELIDRGEAPELADHPDVLAALEAIAQVEAGDDDRAARRGGRPVAGRDYVSPPRRESFDARRPPRDDRGRDDEDDGAVSSASWRPPPARGDGRVWRPPADRDPASEPGAQFREGARDAKDDPGRAADRARETATPTRPMPGRERPAPRPTPRGGIAFDDDEDDLAQYMHPDDVPGPGDDRGGGA